MSDTDPAQIADYVAPKARRDVVCPRCNRLYTSLGLQRHLDYCDGKWRLR